MLYVEVSSVARLRIEISAAILLMQITVSIMVIVSGMKKKHLDS